MKLWALSLTLSNKKYSILIVIVFTSCNIFQWSTNKTSIGLGIALAQLYYFITLDMRMHHIIPPSLFLHLPRVLQMPAFIVLQWTQSSCGWVNQESHSSKEYHDRTQRFAIHMNFNFQTRHQGTPSPFQGRYHSHTWKHHLKTHFFVHFLNKNSFSLLRLNPDYFSQEDYPLNE